MEGPFGGMENIGRFPAGMNMGRMSGRHWVIYYLPLSLTTLLSLTEVLLFSETVAMEASYFPLPSFYWKNLRFTRDAVSARPLLPLNYKKRLLRFP